ncbi:MAG: FAD-dependent oxidoreductase [Nocardioidaceae bacterium]
MRLPPVSTTSAAHRRSPREARQEPAHYPWWLADAGPTASRSPLVGEVGADVVIVGGGFTGLWTALAIKQRSPGTHVVLLEAATCGWAASGRNGGSVNGYWSTWSKLPDLVGPEPAEEMAMLGSEAQAEIRHFCDQSDTDTGLNEAGFAMVATSAAQEDAVTSVLHSTRNVPEAYRPRHLDDAELWRMTRNPSIARGILFPEGATLQPALLVRALVNACEEHGVVIHETSPVTDIDRARSVVVTETGRVHAREIVLATNAWLSALDPIARHTTNLSSHVAVTEPLPDVVSRLDWPQGRMVRDARMFLHWIRTTPDDRFVVGTGAGPLSHGGRVTRAHTHHRPSTRRVTEALAAFVPEAAHARIDAAWGGSIDMSSDSCPYFATLQGTRIHYGTGYSGHGVNAAWIGGQVLASLALGRQDRWTRSAFCTRRRPVFPPEPLRYLGGAAVRRHTIALEDAADRGETPSPLTRVVAALPRLLGIRVGTR